MITASNSLHFVRLHDQKIDISELVIKIPGSYGLYHTDDYCNSGILFLNKENSLYFYSGGNSFQELDLNEGLAAVAEENEAENIGYDLIFGQTKIFATHIVAGEELTTVLFFETARKCKLMLLHLADPMTSSAHSSGEQIKEDDSDNEQRMAQVMPIIEFQLFELDKDERLVGAFLISGDKFPDFS